MIRVDTANELKILRAALHTAKLWHQDEERKWRGKHCNGDDAALVPLKKHEGKARFYSMLREDIVEWNPEVS